VERPTCNNSASSVLVCCPSLYNVTKCFAFAAEMAKIGKRAYVVLAIMGYGEEHDRALQVYQRVATGNDHVRVVSFGNTTDPNRIADAILSLAT